MNVMEYNLLLSAERRVLFAAAEHLLGTSWLNSPPLTRLQWFLYGHTDFCLPINIKLFSLVQVNILSTQRVFVNININVWNFCVICLHDAGLNNLVWCSFNHIISIQFHSATRLRSCFVCVVS